MFGHLSVSIGLAGFREVGGLGVQIFFGMSGFLITTLLLAEERKNGRISLPAFYRRRAFRILPAAFVFLLIVGILGATGTIPLTFSRWLSTIFFAANYSSAPTSWYVGHFWSLAVEEHFYLLWPAALCLIPKNRHRLVLAVAVAIMIAIWRAIDFSYQLTWTDNAYFVGRTDINADAILLGAVFALALADERLGPIIRRVVHHRLASLAALTVFALTFVVHADPAIELPLLTVRAIVVPVMILATMDRPSGLLGRALESAPMRFIGVISYGLYLWQQLFLSWKPTPGLSAVQYFPLNLVAPIICAVASYWFIEQPMIRLGRPRRFASSAPGI